MLKGLQWPQQLNIRKCEISVVERKETEDIVVTAAVSNSMFDLLYEFSIFKVATVDIEKLFS